MWPRPRLSLMHRRQPSEVHGGKQIPHPSRRARLRCRPSGLRIWYRGQAKRAQPKAEQTVSRPHAGVLARPIAALSWNGLNGIAPTARGLLLNPNRGIGFVVQTTHAKEFALAHWLVGGADGGRLCLRCFDGAGIVRENIAGDALASGTTLQWAPTSKTWQAGAVMQESDLNRRQTVRFGPEVAFAQIGIIGFDGQIEVEALRLYGLPEDAPAILSGCPALPAGGRTLMFSASWDLPSMPPGATSNADVTVPGARRGDFADASLDTSSIAFVLDCHVWSNDKVRVTARNVSLSTVDLPAAALHVQVVKRRVG